jgi:hypothetical protein
MRTILIRSALLLFLVGFALPSTAQAQRYGHGGTHQSRSISYRTSHHGYRTHHHVQYRPIYRTHRASYGRYPVRPSYHYSSPYRTRRRVYSRCR